MGTQIMPLLYFLPKMAGPGIEHLLSHCIYTRYFVLLFGPITPINNKPQYYDYISLFILDYLFALFSASMPTLPISDKRGI